MDSHQLAGIRMCIFPNSSKSEFSEVGPARVCGNSVRTSLWYGVTLSVGRRIAMAGERHCRWKWKFPTGHFSTWEQYIRTSRNSSNTPSRVPTKSATGCGPSCCSHPGRAQKPPPPRAGAARSTIRSSESLTFDHVALCSRVEKGSCEILKNAWHRIGWCRYRYASGDGNRITRRRHWFLQRLLSLAQSLSP